MYRPILVLTSEFEPKHLAIAKQYPQKRLGSCLVFSKLAPELEQPGEVITVRGNAVACA